MNSNSVRYIDPVAVATIRTALRETLNNPTMLQYDLLTMAIACEGLANDLRQKAATGKG